MRSMVTSLSHSINKTSQIDKKELKNKYIDKTRSMMTSLSLSINKKIMQIDKKEPKNKFIDKMRSMMTSLSQSVSKKIMQIDKKELKNNMTSLSQSETDKKISQAVLIEKFPSTYQRYNKDLNEFALLLRKDVYPYEYMDNFGRFNEESLPIKKYFYSELNKEDITDEDHKHAQKVWKEFNIKNLGEYHDLYVQGDTTLLADVFENFRNKCMEIYERDPAHF